ncbi:hypothetical protein AYO20_09436 [Fonsecaea nubica]|uniref:Zn(2)-C6 fungal-type domain-containing protein n=1 Tax=Fonsecaea nubica TaxID=856822 RepID=A0A178CET2_9EURO|nr:hypothetical protein AYO20_09436 [Fonsecaea nubica]OAL28488.1 hypothetical protein AYO20_09436 [Fonsecaea nubica]
MSRKMRTAEARDRTSKALKLIGPTRNSSSDINCRVPGPSFREPIWPFVGVWVRMQELVQQGPGGVEEDNPASEASEKNRKRARLQSTRYLMTQGRRRAITACQNCRARKSKCSNERPTCSKCATLGTPCVYNDRIDHSSFDPASLLILQKLNEIIDRLDSSLTANIQLGSHEPDTTWSPSIQGNLERTSPSPSRETAPRALQLDQEEHVSNDGLAEYGYRKVPPACMAVDTVLTWPIFGNLFQADFLISALFIPDEGVFENATGPQERSQNRAVNFEDAPALVDRFLAFVHTKNPILDVPEIRASARRIAEEGPGWDASSCLVVPSDNHYEQDARQISSRFYELARRRIGCLKQTVIASQCYLLSGIYLMYSLQPLRAWNEFLQASVNYDMYLRRQKNLPLDISSPQNSDTRRVEQRLYWTCFKSECEIRQEIHIPESGLSNLRYPYMFPSPPSAGSPAAQEPVTQGASPTQASPPSARAFPSSFEFSEQQSWFYYLTEITLTRIGNRILTAFYQHGHSAWANMTVSDAVRIAERFDHQITEVGNWMPGPISFHGDYANQSLQELRNMVRGRFTAVYSQLYQPFIYFMIHHGPDTSAEDLILLQPWLDRAMHHLIDSSLREGYMHRHHGTWYVCRHRAAMALILVGAKKSGRIQMPDAWEAAISHTLRILRYWENESPDIAKARLVIQDLYNAL